MQNTNRVFPPQKGSHFKSWWASERERVHLTDVCQEKNSVRILLAFEKNSDSARLNENFTAFTFCMKKFCCGTKYTETKINLKRLHLCWREGDNSGKTER